MKLWLVRHGQSEANAGLRSAHAATIPLTALGRTQAEAVARRFPEAPRFIAVSPYTRAQQTAEPTIARFPNATAETWPIEEFTYLAPERCANTTSAERLPMVREFWGRADPDWVDGPGVESFREFFARVREALESARSLEVPFAALFTHGQFLQCAMWQLAGHTDASEMAALRAFMDENPVPNAAVLEVDLARASAVGPLSTEHLRPDRLTY